MRILFLPGSYSSPAARFRIWHYVEPLRALGHQVVVRVTYPERTWMSSLSNKALRHVHNRSASLFRIGHVLWLTRDIKHFDVVMMNRDIVPETHIEFLEPLLARRNPSLIFDFDDAIHLGNREHKLRKILPYFALITPGNEYLADFARECHKRVTVVPTTVDTDKFAPLTEKKPGNARQVRVGWSGSEQSIHITLFNYLDLIVKLQRQLDFEFVVISDQEPVVPHPDLKWTYWKWTPETEGESVARLDIGIMPLLDDEFQKGKCGLKLLQYMSVGIPVIASPVGVNKEIVQNHVTGYLAAQEEEWSDALKSLIGDVGLRACMGEAGRQRCVEHYSVQHWLPILVDLFSSCSNSST